MTAKIPCTDPNRKGRACALCATLQGKKLDRATTIVDALLGDLCGRSGFDVDVDTATRRQWRKEWIKIVMEAL